MDNDNEEESMMVCVNADAVNRVAGYQANCHKCDIPVWVSYSSSEQLTVVSKLICMKCFMEMDIRPEDIDIAPIEQGQMNDVIKHDPSITKEDILAVPGKLRKLKKLYEESKIQLSGGISGGTSEEPTERGSDR